MTSSAIAREVLEELRQELFEFLRIPSVSARAEHDGDVRQGAEWIRRRMADAGLNAELHETRGHPIVLGEWRGAGADAPTVLVYGHYDVQPPEPLEEWTAPPFEPEVRDGRIYARGATDDKGQFYLHVKALEVLLRSNGTLPVNVVVVAEGEEEVGSAHLLPFLREHRERLKADAVVISDTAMLGPGTPSLLFSLRGLAYVEARVRGPAGDLHSGSFGGAVVNPANALAAMVATLHDDDGRVAVEGFYDDVVEWDDATRQDLRRLPFDEDSFREGIGAPALGGESGYAPQERLWIRPTCDVNGLLSGYTGEGAKTVLPSRAMAKISCRLVPDQDPARITELLSEHLRRVAPEGVEVEVVPLHSGRPWRASTQGPFFDAAAAALETGFGTKPVLAGEGGSIPIVAEFEEELGAPVLLVGFGLPGANMHAPDEWFPEDHLEKGLRTLVDLYPRLARSGGND